MTFQSDARRAAGFTLIEVLAAIFLTSIVMSLTVNMYINLTRSSEAAIEKLKTSVQGLAVLDRVARDLESTVLLVKDDETDPLHHPWLFYAEAGFDDFGADRLKFMTRNHHPISDSRLERDLATVSYVLLPTDDGTYELLRSASPRIPDELDREFPTQRDEGGIVAEGVRRFGFRFLSEDGEWSDEWDSTTLADSGELPIAVEIQLVMSTEDDRLEDENGEFTSAVEVAPMVRRVLLPVRPIDLVAVIERGMGLAGMSGDEDECYLVNDCAAANGNLKRRPMGALWARLVELGIDDPAGWRFDTGKACVQSLDIFEDIRDICDPSKR